MQETNSAIESLIFRAASGDKQALQQVCERLKVPIFAAAIHSGASWRDASVVVLPILKSLCTDLLEDRFEPSRWRERMATSVRMSIASDRESDAPGLSVPRLAKRKAVRNALTQMPLPQLTAVLLEHIDSVGATDMVGIVADTESEVISVMLSAHQTLTQVVEETKSAEENQ